MSGEFSLLRCDVKFLWHKHHLKTKHILLNFLNISAPHELTSGLGYPKTLYVWISSRGKANINIKTVWLNPLKCLIWQPLLLCLTKKKLCYIYSCRFLAYCCHFAFPEKIGWSPRRFEYLPLHFCSLFCLLYLFHCRDRPVLWYHRLSRHKCIHVIVQFINIQIHVPNPTYIADFRQDPMTSY